MKHAALKRIGLCFIALLSVMQIAWINPLRDRVEEANRTYSEEKYEEAIQQYTDIAATYAPESKELHFNIGDAWYRQGNYEKAIEEYQSVVGASDEKFEAQAHYNIGNCYFRQEDYAKAIESYIRSLKLHPDDEDAKYNLELARRKLKEQIDQNKDQQQQDQQQQNQQQDQQQQDQQNQQQQQEQQQQDQQQQENQEQQNQEQQEQQQEQNQQQEQEPQELQEQDQAQAQPDEPREEMTREQAMQLLKNLEDDEKEKRKEFKRPRELNSRVRVDKDW